ncbi:conserved hypothetical protein [Neospora caninum Liverpool]|uniref:Uncharacterized protein n=1 Tax=Neospora caninum (strain Liverpool) TaxID=572307 RepID=F0VKG6_NEOCL|nr:conserved hypothetical protein [Neospora caninum Liverpool]CBZ54567.1 conserved hypothetical protein [Neospora caninum Liverpool]CEL69281.1 TPA: hypothetical protein BN1204_049950 [Neospora caninum Liverpool]|eukprot:XP_003884597.1 conserved hypothetical protein [Neospora caninum Liverpool]
MHTSAMGPADLLNATTVASTLYPLRAFDVAQPSSRHLRSELSCAAPSCARFPRPYPISSGAEAQPEEVTVDATWELHLRTRAPDNKEAQRLGSGFSEGGNPGTRTAQKSDAAQDNYQEHARNCFAVPSAQLSRGVLWERLVSRASVLLPSLSPSGIVQLLFLLHRAGYKPQTLLDHIATQLLEQEACAAPPEYFWCVWTANDLVLFVHVLGLHRYRHETLLTQVMKELEKSAAFLMLSDLAVLLGACNRLLALPAQGSASLVDWPNSAGASPSFFSGKELRLFTLLATAQVSQASLALPRDLVALVVGVLRAARALSVPPSKTFLVAAVRRLGAEISGRNRHGSRPVALSARAVQRAIYAVLATRQMLLSSTSSHAAATEAPTPDRNAENVERYGLYHEQPRRRPRDSEGEGDGEVDGGSRAEEEPGPPAWSPNEAVKSRPRSRELPSPPRPFPEANGEGSTSPAASTDTAAVRAGHGPLQMPTRALGIQNGLEEASLEDVRRIDSEVVAVVVQLLQRLSDRLGDLSPVEALEILQALEEHRHLRPPQRAGPETGRGLSLSSGGTKASVEGTERNGDSELCPDFLLLPDIEGFFFHVERYRHLLSSEQVTQFNQLLAAHLNGLPPPPPERLPSPQTLSASSSASAFLPV